MSDLSYELDASLSESLESAVDQAFDDLADAAASIPFTFKFPLDAEGQGEFKQWAPSLRRKVTLKAQITTPDTGTFDVQVYDGSTLIYRGSGLQPNQQIEATYQTGWTVSLRAVVQWSKRQAASKCIVSGTLTL